MKTTFKRLAALVQLYPKLAITGFPRAGKTTLAKRLESQVGNVIHADDLKDLGWSEASAELAKRVNEHKGPLIVEGVAVPRALRKGMKVDAVIVMNEPREPLKSGQTSMGKGVQTVLREWQASNPNAVVLPWSEADE